MTLVMFKSAAGLNNYDVIRESLGMKSILKYTGTLKSEKINPSVK